MELQQLRYFQIVAKHEHMTRAAEELHISQPSLSITISRLERELGIQLFDRHKRQIKLNRIGETFLQRVAGVLSQLDDAQQEVIELSSENGGIISVASTSLALLPHLLRGFLENHPLVKFRLIQVPVSQMRQSLDSGVVDLCISSPMVQGPNIENAVLLKEEIVVIVPKNHPLAGREQLHLSELAGESFVSLKTGYGLRDLMDAQCMQCGFVPHLACEIDDPPLISTLVKAGIGISFLPYSAWPVLGDETLIALHIESPTCQRTVGMAWTKEHPRTRAAELFHQYARSYFQVSESLQWQH